MLRAQRQEGPALTRGTANAVVQRGARVPEEPRLSICILVLDRARFALRCLDSLRRPGATPPETEIVLVANGMPPDQLELVTGHEDVVLIVNGENIGFAGGSNQAASVARAPLLIFLNDDSTVEEGCVDALVRAASEDPAIGAVGARILSVDGTLEEAGSVLWRDGTTDHVGDGLPAGSDAYLDPRDVDYASANGLLVTRTAWELVGGFDERYFPAYVEDVDLCLALATRGFHVRYEPRARLIHAGSQSSSVPYREFLMSRNQAKLVQKWGTILGQFEPRPPESRGPVFDAALRRAVARARVGIDSSSVPASVRPGPITLSPDDRSKEFEQLKDDYRDYLEHLLTQKQQRIAALHAYLDARWRVRVHRWVTSRLGRPSN